MSGQHRELIATVQRLSSCRDLDSIIAVLRGAARRLTGADGITVVLRDGDLCHYVEEDAIAPLWKGRRFPMSTCISGWCMLHRSRVAITNIYEDPRIPKDAYRPTFVQSLAMAPIRTEDPIGAIGAYWADRHSPSRIEMETLQALGDSASVAFANVQLIDKLMEASQRKDALLAMLAHELRNPLAPIRSALHVLQVAGSDNAKSERAREIIERQVLHLSRIVSDLVDVATLTTGRRTLKRERLDLAQIVRQTACDREDVLAGAGLRLRVTTPETPVWIEGDGTGVTRVVAHLLENAMKFTPSGGSVEVSLDGDTEPGIAVLAVRDNGTGIEPRMLDRIFETFTQADDSLERSSGGLGLGLTMARNLLALHGGTIEAASKGLGQGATFTVRLPRLQEAPVLARTITPRAEPRSARVLIVEDNRDAAESLRMLLELSGYEVTVAYSGTEGLATALAIKPEIVLCDIGLPGMNGFDLAGTLRQNPETARARLIAVTGYGRDEDRRRALSVGFDEHLIKPLDPSLLLSHLADSAGPSAPGS